MSMLEYQIKELRNYERIFKNDRIDGNLSPIFGQAADTIESFLPNSQKRIWSGRRGIMAVGGFLARTVCRKKR